MARHFRRFVQKLLKSKIQGLAGIGMGRDGTVRRYVVAVPLVPQIYFLVPVLRGERPADRSRNVGVTQGWAIGLGSHSLETLGARTNIAGRVPG